MSRTAKWKLEKTKVKVVFRLQFHATHIPQTGWDKLFVSFIPADSGKVTGKTSKANVRNGTCKWADPIYETTRLLQDTKTRQYDEKLYKLVVAMGSSRSSLVGEATFNLADYADASKPSAISLPLNGCNSGTVLHVTVQPLTSKTGFREFEQQRELRETGMQTSNQNRNDGPPENLSASADKVNARVRFKSESRELPSLEEVVELNEDSADSVIGNDVSSNTSESLYAEKHDSSTHEIDSLKSTMSGDLGGLSLGQSPHLDKGDPSDHRLLAQGANDWVQGWSSDYSMDNDLANAYEENSRLRGSLDVAESSILQLKLELGSLQNYANELGAKTQEFGEVLDAEIASGEELAKEVSVLKSVCSNFKDGFEQLKHSRLSPHSTSTELLSKDHVQLFHDLQKRWIQGLLVMEDKVREVEDKACQEYQESDLRFLHPDLESLKTVLQDLREGTTEVVSLLNVKPAELVDVKEIGATHSQEPEQFVPVGELEDIKADHLGRPIQVSQVPYPIDATIALESKIGDLSRELEESKIDRDNLTRKLDQMECYYEALIQELEESQKQMLGELQNLRNEHSTCLYTISSCKTQMETMHQDMNKQFLRFTEDKCDLESLNKELETKAMNSETALQKARWNYSVAVGQLQKDLELLSFQVLSMFETNENLIRQACTEPSQHCLQECLEENAEAVDSCLHKDEVNKPMKTEQVLASDKVVQKKNLTINEDLGVKTPRDLDALVSPIVPLVEFPSTDTKCKDSRKAEVAEVMEYQIHNSELKRQLLSGEILFENLKRSLQSQEELYQNTEDELCKMHMVNVHLDVFSKVLQETMREANNGIKIMKQEMNELAEKLAHSTLSEESLMLRLETALDDVNIQRENNAISITKCSELALQNEILKDKLEGIFAENCLLLQKVSEYEVLLTECRSFESKYEACTSEKTELMYLLKQESLEKFSLKNEVSSMQEEMEILKADLDSESAFKDNLERTVSLLQDRLWDLRSTMASYDQQINGPLVSCGSVQEERESKSFLSIFLHLEQLQNKAYEKILELIQEKKDVEEQRGIAQRSLSSMESFNLLVKQKYESEIQDMVNKLDMSMDNVEKLQLEIENVSMKLQNSLEAEEKYAEHIREMFTKLELFEVNMQHVTSENADLAQKILVLEKVNEELEKTKLTIVDSTRENQAMMISLQAGNEESLKLENELSDVKQNLNCLSDELQKERSLRIGLEGTVSDLSSQLNLKNDKLFSLDTVNSELVQLKKLVSDLELELSNVKENLNSMADELQTVRSSKMELEGTVSDLSSQLNLKNDQLVSYDTVSSELFQLKKLVSELELEISNAKENLNCKSDELQTEKSLRIECEGRVSDLSSQLNLKNNQLISFDTLNAELVQLKKLVSDLELEKSRVCHCLLHGEESGRKAEEDNSSLLLQVTNLETHLAALHECFLAADVELIYTRNQFQTREQQLVQQLESLDRSYRELHLKHLDVLKTTNDRMSNEAQYAEENSRLLTTLNLLRSDLDSAFIEKKTLLDRSNSISLELEKHKTRAAVAEIGGIQDKHQHELEIEHLKQMLLSSEEVIDNLTSSQYVLEITVIVLQAKLNEQHMQLLLLEEYASELMMLRNHQKDLAQKLSEQILKTEEFKNLSIHLKELKEKADAENLQAREKRDTEVPSVAQESLRMVFIKEQCETKLQEMKTQLYASKKHGEEMLLKLQDALNEVENRKKTEASHLKRNEELSLKISELETELHAVLADKREKVRAYDRMKAELECSMLSLDCCKEEKQKLEASLRECNVDRTKITGELSSLKDRLESFASTRNIRDTGSFKPYVVDLKSSESVKEEISSDMEDESQVSSQDSITSKSVLDMSKQTVVDEENLLQNNIRHLALIKEHVNTQSLMSSMDQLHKELERMKNENLASLTPRDEQDFQQVFPGLQRELLQLRKANEQLGSIFPLFNDFSSGGNAMERVLALEMELAEALQAKRKPTVHFQSSFLKQHSDEEAIFQSFRDINELIQDMLELKGRYGTVETELKEMHDRYSQLSLQFAEVEGERQKLVMTLKNNRVPKKTAYLYRSASDSLGDHS